MTPKQRRIYMKLLNKAAAESKKEPKWRPVFLALVECLADRDVAAETLIEIFKARPDRVESLAAGALYAMDEIEGDPLAGRTVGRG